MEEFKLGDHPVYEVICTPKDRNNIHHFDTPVVMDPREYHMRYLTTSLTQLFQMIHPEEFSEIKIKNNLES